MDVLKTQEGLAALSRIAAGFSEVGAGLDDLVGIASRSLRAEEKPDERAGVDQEREVRLLWGRIGPDNKRFLYDIAREFRPGDVFTLEEVADQLGISKGSARARMMNLGRTVKALAGDAPVLWDVQWDSEDGENSYEWDFDTHRAILKVVEG
jgi:hypothetical protein